MFGHAIHNEIELFHDFLKMRLDEMQKPKCFSHVIPRVPLLHDNPAMNSISGFIVVVIASQEVTWFMNITNVTHRLLPV